MARLTFEGLINMDLFQQEWPKMTAHLVERFSDEMGSDLSFRMNSERPFGSPIEAIFFQWWHLLIWSRDVPQNSALLRPQEAVTVGEKTYRLDFAAQPDDGYAKALKAAGVTGPKIGIELDGHDWHERTKEQVTYRNQRDRDLQAAGWIVLHYSGSELIRDPFTTVHDAHYKVDGIYYDFGVKLVDAQAV